jgi:hypothetical protein
MSVQARGKNDGERESPRARGFSAQLRGAGLWDLVQMECLSRSHRVVQVVGEGGVGYLYFDLGQIAHATTARNTGEDAALEILGWTNGSFQSCERAWPPYPTIRTSHEALILHVAKLRDESGASNLVAFPARSAPAEDGDRYEELELTDLDDTEAAEGEPEMRSPGVDEPVAVPKPVGSGGISVGNGRPELGTGSEFPVMLRLGPNGVILTNRGGNEELADTVAYTHRLLQLTGELLGFDKFTAVEVGFGDGRFVLFDEGDEVVALRPRPETNLQPLRERLGL